MPSGIPVLQVPEEDILARGTTDPLSVGLSRKNTDHTRKNQLTIAFHLIYFIFVCAGLSG